MTSLRHTLEAWTTYQDYVWFLALLAWSGVIGAEVRRRPTNRIFDLVNWISVLALASVAGTAIELVLLVQDLTTPYVKLDFAMGAAQALGTMALLWGCSADWRARRWWRTAGTAILVGLAAARIRWPIEAGCALCALQALAVLTIIRKRPAAFPSGVAVLLVIAPIIATHGPLAYAVGDGRRNNDWSHFALVASGCMFFGGTWLAIDRWRQRLLELGQDRMRFERLRRDLHRAFIALGCWLACGVLLSSWYGRQARVSYENNITHRIAIMIVALDPNNVATLLRPPLHVTKIEHKFYPEGTPVDVATIPETADLRYTTLRYRMFELLKRNSDLHSLYILIPRDGELIIINGSARPPPATTHAIYRHAVRSDYERLEARKDFFDGPDRSNWGTRMYAGAVIIDPTTGTALGWLVGEVTGTRWASVFVWSRVQAMALTALGVGFWSLSLAYRLRRDAREEAERKAAESTSADRAKSAFLAKVSHELRTPIQSVLGYGELLAAAELPEPQRAWVAALQSHGTVMLRLVNDLIDLGALQSGAFRLQSCPTALHSVVDDCVAAIRPAAEEKKLEIRTHHSPILPAWVDTDGVRLRQILLNLLMNAVKYTAAGGVTLSVDRNGPDIDFVVSDTGPGIPAELQGRLFQPFARLDGTSVNGTGLGLALVHGLVQALGGQVWLDTTTDAGARFVVRLRLKECAAPKIATVPTPADARLDGMKIVVAEDNTLVRELLESFLVSRGARVWTATDGIAAEDSTRKHEPNALLLDIGLPRRDGFAVAQALRAEGRNGLRIIGLSAHAGRADEDRARAVGMNAFLTKPVSLSQLARVLSDASIEPAIASRITDLRLRDSLIDQFTRETPVVLAEMEAAIGAEDWPRLQNRAHYLKNSADVIGASALQDACSRFANLPTPFDTTTARKLVAAVIAAFPANISLERNRTQD